MTKYFMTFFCLLVTIIANGQVTSGFFKLDKDLDCGINEGGMRIDKVINKKFKFAIAVDGTESGMQGRIKGSATLIKSNVAVFKNKNCGTLTFYFKPNSRVEIKETNCNDYHGANICFDAIYVKE